MSAKAYGLWGGIIFLILGVVGIFQRPQFIGLNTEWFETLVHLVGGAILVYAGTKAAEAQAAMWAKWLGVIFIVVGVVGFIYPNLFGLIPQVGLRTADNIVHLIYGVVGAWAGWSYKGT